MLKGIIYRSKLLQAKFFVRRNFSNKEPYQGGERNFWQSGNRGPSNEKTSLLGIVFRSMAAFYLFCLLLPFPYVYGTLQQPDQYKKAMTARLGKYRERQDDISIKAGRPKMTDAQFKIFSDATFSLFDPYVSVLNSFGIKEKKAISTESGFGISNFENQNNDFFDADFETNEADFGSDSFVSQTDEQNRSDEDAYNKRWWKLIILKWWLVMTLSTHQNVLYRPLQG